MCCTPTSIRGSGTARSARDGDEHDRRRDRVAQAEGGGRPVARGVRPAASRTSWRSSAWSSSSCSCSAASSGRSSRRGRTRSQDLKAVFANGNRPLPPLSPNHILGTDQLGRDLLSRLLDGARISVTVAFVVQVVIILIGVPVGAIAGWFGGRTDNVADAPHRRHLRLPRPAVHHPAVGGLPRDRLRPGARRPAPRVRGDRPRRLGDRRPA